MLLDDDLKFGATLPDQVDRIVGAYDTYLELIGDVRELYTARALLEREYAAKLQGLARKAAEKQLKLSSVVALGSDPTKAWDGNTVKQNSANSAYDAIIESITKSAQCHIDFADQLTLKTIDTLKALEKHNDGAKKTEIAFFAKIVADRDRTYEDRLKNKQKYDEHCTEVEAFRQKQGRASDDKHADRIAKQAEQQRTDMMNSKNSYLIATVVANRIKAKFYEEDVPNLENELQYLERRLVERFVKVLVRCQQTHMSHLDTLRSLVTHVEIKFNEVNVITDQNLFIEYNLRTFTSPGDWKFEPCEIHYDTEAMYVEPAPKVVLQNRLHRCRNKASELVPLVQSKSTCKRDISNPNFRSPCRRPESLTFAGATLGEEATSMSSQLVAYTPDSSIGAIDELTDRYLSANHQAVAYATPSCILECEVDVIVKAIGGDEGPRQPHDFKSSSFSIPTHCGYCKSSIWGLSKQGKTCKACGLSVHAKCELKVPANCEQAASVSHGSILSRKRGSLLKGGVPEPETEIPPSASSFIQSISSEETPSTDELLQAKVLFNFTANSEFELGVKEGDLVRIVEADDGSGWVKVAGRNGDGGLVPASYLETADHDSGNPEGEQHGSERRVRAIYPYIAQSADELVLQVGDVLVLSPDGDRYADGWFEGFSSEGKRGIFPSTYVEAI